MVPDGTNTAASLPSNSATRSSRRLTVGSSRKTSSPTSAACMAARMAAVGFVTVSLRRSINDSGMMVSWDVQVRRFAEGSLTFRLAGILQKPAAVLLFEIQATRLIFQLHRDVFLILLPV